MDDDLKKALIIGVVGFVIMIAASIALWFFHASEIRCSVVMAIGLITVIVAIIYASFPQYFDRSRKKEPLATEEVPAQTEESVPIENDETPKE